MPLQPFFRDEAGKKQFSFKHRRFLDYTFKLEAEMRNKTESEIAEEVLLSHFLSPHSEFSAPVTMYLFGEKGIEQCCEAVFCQFAALPNKADPSMLELIEFVANQEAISPAVITGKEKELYHFKSSLKSVIDLLEEYMESGELFPVASGQGMLSVTSIEVNTLRRIFETIQDEKEDKHLYLLDIITIIRAFWLVGGTKTYRIYAYTHTYRLLADICRLAKWNNCPQNQYQLLEILKRQKIKG